MRSSNETVEDCATCVGRMTGHYYDYFNTLQQQQQQQQVTCWWLHIGSQLSSFTIYNHTGWLLT